MSFAFKFAVVFVLVIRWPQVNISLSSIKQSMLSSTHVKGYHRYGSMKPQTNKYKDICY